MGTYDTETMTLVEILDEIQCLVTSCRNIAGRNPTPNRISDIQSKTEHILTLMGSLEMVEGSYTDYDGVLEYHSDEYNESPALLLIKREGEE